MQKPKIVYIVVDDDDYELPFAMGDTMRGSPKRLASLLGIYGTESRIGDTVQRPSIIHIVSRKLDLPLIWRIYSTLARTETFTK